MEYYTVDERYTPLYKHLMTCAKVEIFDQSVIPDRYRLILIREGSGIIRIGNRSYPIIAPAIYCLNEKEEVSLPSRAKCVASTVYFHPSVINNKFTDLQQLFQHSYELTATESQDRWLIYPFADRNSSYYGCVPIDPSSAKQIALMINEASDLLTELAHPQWPCLSRSLLVEILFSIRRLFATSRADDVKQVPVVDSEAIEEIIQYLYTHYRAKITLDDIAKQFATNKTTLNQQFKAATGVSIIAYLNIVRMQLASSLLRNTKLPTNDIMDSIGFQDSSHFIRAFKKHAGHSPSHYPYSLC
ncbi:MAG: AraC family transcriptional regulator [Paenibacillaceae bacterium]